MFDGISCGRVALERAGIAIEQYSAFEIEKNAIAVSQKNYPDILRYGDVCEGDYKAFRGCDLLLGGSPCTHWSVARAARSDREITPDGEGFRLFMEYVRALEESKCAYFLYENNNSIHQNIKDEISARLGVPPIMINSALVSAQHRKRCYWTNIPHVTMPKDKRIYLKDVIIGGAEQHGEVSDIPICVNSQSGSSSPLRKQPSLASRIYSVNGKNPALTTGYFTLAAIPADQKASGAGIYSVRDNKTAFYDGRANYTLNLPNGNYIIRNLLPIEFERLQTLPDNYTDNIPKSHRFRCIGNGWTVDVIAHILKGLIGGTDNADRK